MNEAEFIAMLEERGVPADLIPQLVDRRRDRRRRRNKEELRLRLDREAKTELERKERAAFSRWFMFLIFLYLLDEKNPRSFFHRAFREMHDRQERPDPILGEQACIERGFTAVALAKFDKQEVEQALEHGCCAFERLDRFDRGEVTLTQPMAHAQRSIKQEQDSIANAPKPAPAIELQLEQSAPIQQADVLDEQRQKLAQPDF